jgi:hypothetical protein
MIQYFERTTLDLIFYENNIDQFNILYKQQILHWNIIHHLAGRQLEALLSNLLVVTLAVTCNFCSGEPCIKI